MQIKICGLTRAEDIAAVNRYLPDYAGFVFAPGRRQISPETAARLKAMLSPGIPAVGVFVNASKDMILSLADRQVIDIIQLHGDETEEDAFSIMEQCPLPVIKAVRVKTREDILKAQGFPCRYLLLDTYVKGIYGGSGQHFDWSMIPSMEKPFFLAGGLNFENLTMAMKTSACCLDVSSCVETEGKKDPVKIGKIIELVRRK